MKKVNQVWRVGITTIVLLAILILLASKESGAQTASVIPLKAGQAYHACSEMGRSFNFTVVTPPVSNGWMVVEIHQSQEGGKMLSDMGFKKYKRFGLNLNQLFIIEDLTE